MNFVLNGRLPTNVRANGIVASGWKRRMPIGKRHELIGLLLENHGGLILDVDGGGTWRLDARPGDRTLLGQRVRVDGIRDGFDLLAVKRIDRA